MKRPLCSLFSCLIVLFTFIGVSAHAAPARVIDFAMISVGPGSITFSWTTPAPAAGAMLMENDVRCSTVSITALNWATRLQVVGEPIPMTPGVVQTALVTGIASNTQYYCALKVRDSLGWSLLSNQAAGNTAVSNTANLGWTPTNQVGLMGYKVCTSVASQPIDCTDMGTQTSVILTGLPAGTNCWVVNAYYDRRVFEAAYGPVDPVSVGYTDPNIPYLIGSLNTKKVCKTF